MQKTAKSMVENRFADIENVFEELVQSAAAFGDLERMKALVKGQMLAAMGFLVQEEDLSLPLSTFATRALARETAARAGLSVAKGA
jgi:hypothetical protein